MPWIRPAHIIYKEKNMRKKIVFVSKFIAIISVMALVFVGCGADSSTVNTSSTRTVIDTAGNEVVIPDVVESYAVVFAGDVDIFAMLDGCEHMSAYSETVLKYELVEKAYPFLKDRVALPRRNVSIESILESGPQVVILRESDYPELAEQLKELNVPVVDMNFEDYESLKKCVTLAADILNTEEARDKAERFNRLLDEEVKESEQFVSSHNLDSGISVLTFRDADDLEAYSPDRMMRCWSDACKLDYALKEAPGNQNVKLTVEQLSEFDPDYIFFTFGGNAEKMMTDERFVSLTAVKNSHVYQEPAVFNAFAINGCETIMQMKWVMSVIWPDEIDYDIVKEVQDFYTEFFDYEMDDATVKNILGIE